MGERTVGKPGNRSSLRRRAGPTLPSVWPRAFRPCGLAYLHLIPPDPLWAARRPATTACFIRWLWVEALSPGPVKVLDCGRSGSGFEAGLQTTTVGWRQTCCGAHHFVDADDRRRFARYEVEEAPSH